MPYNKTNWKDTIKDASGNIIEKGTPLAAKNLNKMEDGIANATEKAEKAEGDLVKVSQQLADTSEQVQSVEAAKMDKNTTDISVTQINKNLGKIDQTFLSDELLQQMAGTTPVNATPADGSITTEKIATKAVTPQVTTFFKLSRNLFNKNTVVSGHVDQATGEIAASDTYVTSDYIPVKENTTYTVTKGYRYAFYNAEGSFLSGGNLVGTNGAKVTSPAGAAYIRVGIHTSVSLDSYMVVEGETLPASYEAYGADFIPRERQERQIGLSRENLDVVYSLNDDIPTGADLNSLYREGTYTGIANGNYRNLPPDFITSRAFALELIPLFKGQNRWFLQRLTDYTDGSNVYIRRVDATGAATFEWTSLKSIYTASTPILPFTGQTIVQMGDSVTEFGTIPETVARKTGATVHNCGFGGTRMATHPNRFDDPGCVAALVDAIVSGDFSLQQSKIDDPNNPFSAKFKANFETVKSINFGTVNYLFVMYGTNDYMGTANESVPLGVESDFTRNTFRGAMNYSIEKLLTAFPQLKIVFATPTWRENASSLGGGEVDTTPNSLGVYLVEYADAVIERANAHHLPALDLFRTSGINKYTKITYLKDTVHPNSTGDELLGNKIGAWLGSLF